jgi:hypothetical protein
MNERSYQAIINVLSKRIGIDHWIMFRSSLSDTAMAQTSEGTYRIFSVIRVRALGFEGISHGPLRDMIMASYDMTTSHDMIS